MKGYSSWLQVIQRRRVRVVIRVALIIVVIAGAIATYFITIPPTYMTARNRAIGANISISGSEVPRAIKAAVRNISHRFPAEFQPLDSIAQITPSGNLPAPVILRFRPSRQVKSGDTVLLATTEATTGPWTLIQPVISKDGWYASAQTSHLSWWQPILYNVQAAANDFKQEVLDGVSGDFFTRRFFYRVARKAAVALAHADERACVA